MFKNIEHIYFSNIIYMKKQIISFILVFLCAFNSKAATASNDETATAVDLTAGFYHRWDGIDANAKVTPENVYGACVLNESTGLPYGDGNVSCLNYADLSGYGKLVVTATEGEPRFCFNRAINDGDVTIEFPRDKASKSYETVDDNGDGSKTYTIDLSQIVADAGYAHLNCIKGANWANTTITSMKLLPITVQPSTNSIDLVFTEAGSKTFGPEYFKVSGDGVTINYTTGEVTASKAGGKIFVLFKNSNLSAAKSIVLDVTTASPYADICNTGQIFNEGASINAWYGSKYNMQNLDKEAMINQVAQGYNWNNKMGSVTKLEWNINNAGTMKINSLTITSDVPTTAEPDPEVNPITSPIDLVVTEAGSKTFGKEYFKVSGDGVSIDYSSGVVKTTQASGQIYVLFNNVDLSTVKSVVLNVTTSNPYSDICNTGVIFNNGESVNTWYGSKYNMQNLDLTAIVNQVEQDYTWNSKMSSVTKVQWNISNIGEMKINGLTITYDAPKREDPVVSDFIVGDVNADDKVNIEDIPALINVLKNNTENVNADVNEDNIVDIDDVEALSNILLDNEIEQKWVATWASAQMATAKSDEYPAAPGLSNNSIRQIIQVSVAGKKVRLKLSNQLSSIPLEIKGVEIAVAQSAGATPNIYEGTTKSLTFGGKSAVIIPAGEMVVSDPIPFAVRTRENVAITIHYGNYCNENGITSHPGSRTTSYIANGNTTDFSSASRTDHWFNISALDVVANKNSRAIAVLGNSITDGRGSNTNGQDRWTDALSRRLLKNESTKDVAVLNLGIGGNCVVNGGLGPVGLSRYSRDILQQSGVKYVIIFEGTNDIGGHVKAETLISAYQDMINQAHNAGLKIYGATITPFKGSGYYSAEQENCRTIVNNWIRTNGNFDGYIDFDKIVQDPNDPESLPAKYLFQNDYLHLNAEGYKTMGESIDLELFENY